MLPEVALRAKHSLSSPWAKAPRHSVDLVVAIPHLGAGGAQRVVSLLLNHWQSRGVRVVVLTLFAKPDAYALDPGIQREAFVRSDDVADGRGPAARVYVVLDNWLAALKHRLPLLHPLVYLLRLPLRVVRRLRAKLLTQIAKKRPDRRTPRAEWLRARLQHWRPRVVISFLSATNIQTLMAARGLDLPVVISERNDPALQKLDPPWETLRPLVYREAALVTANSAGALATMCRFVPEHKLRQVANPLAVPPCATEIQRHQSRIIFVARLVEQKAPEVLIDAFALIASDFPDWRLDMVGDGPLREALEARAMNLGIAERTTFHGHCTDPYPLLYRASVFVLPSRFEGMPNSMLEAMACGLAVVVSDASPGPLELIRNGETGLVAKVDDVAVLAESMRALMSDNALRRRLASAAQAEAENMRLERVAADWEAMLRELGVDLVQTEAATGVL
jgi:glycosyltransferase involved in cell wall biosynthesis